mmetsp:Transcript_73215/g.172061  ORF Transcript_73215/g.172061 Transcript_73215/m.172061 type:complete len:83 (+) Transcript_73215:756-1004(+)
MGLPFQIFVATTKTSEPDWFRKPCIGMWEYMRDNCNGGQELDLAQSFFVGDAAGRPKDHGNSDREFAAQIGIRFYTETEFFS